MHNLICDFCSSDQRFAHGLVCSPHPASFRFHLTMDTLAFGYILPTTGRIQDLHPLETCAARRTSKKSMTLQPGSHIDFCSLITGYLHQPMLQHNRKSFLFCTIPFIPIYAPIDNKNTLKQYSFIASLSRNMSYQTKNNPPTTLLFRESQSSISLTKFFLIVFPYFSIFSFLFVH